MELRAPAKLNLCLYVGPAREDGLHEIRSLFQPLSLADRLTLSIGELSDEVVCPGVEQETLVGATLMALRELGWRVPPLRVEIEKRIPIAAGLGGGSADAGALLRMALAGTWNGFGSRVAGITADQATRIAFELGADVPSQLAPAFALVGGAGERVERLPAPPAYALVLVPFAEGLSAGEVFAEADRLGARREPDELEELEGRLRAAAGSGAAPLEYADLLHNDLQPAALALRPAIGPALVALERAGAARALVTGSGPTAFGLFADLPAADRAADALRGTHPAVLVATPDRER